MKKLATLLLSASLPVLACAGPVGAREAAAPAAQESFIEMPGGRNFRDAGGYRTADGRTVQHHRLYRSGSLGRLTLEGQQALRALGVSSVIDLRTSQERAADTSNFLSLAGLGYWTRDYSLSLGNLGSLFGDPAALTPEKVSAMMIEGYRTMPKEQAPAYRELFGRLLADKGAVVVNCTAGKDRTGIATALVLTALGVPYETVREDFLLSNGAPGMHSLSRDVPGMPAGGPAAEAMKVLAGVQGEWLDAAFDAMRAEHGSVEGYMQAELGIGPAEIERLRARMLQEG